ncbi:MAG: hypothetical protein AAF801_14050 [Pseudomonadota bacterium]
MTTMMELPQSEATLQGGVSQIAQNMMSYDIKRVGARPLRFQGSELAMAMSYTPAIPYWYEINLYRTLDQTFVTAIRRFHQSEDKQDTTQAWEAASIGDAIDKLTAYDAANDVIVSYDLDVAAAPAAEMAAIAMQLMSQITDARNHYQSLVGEFLYDLENDV